jgi:DNA-binding MarR family transcriptional regulator
MSSSHPIPPTGVIWRLSMKWRVAIDRALADLGLTHAQYAVLAPLFGMASEGRRPSQRELADVTGLEPLYISKLLRGLERDGFVERSPNPDDARAVRLVLTRHGRQVTTRAIALVVALQDDLTKPLGGASSRRTRDFVSAAQKLLTGEGQTGEAKK